MDDAFSKRHPVVNFLFFAGAICLGVVIQHPVYLLTGMVCSGAYYLLLTGRKGQKTIFGLLPLFVFLTAINPLFNTYGERVLFHVFGRPYTLEALLYGGAIAAVFVVTVLWFGCYNRVLTGDKFTALFGSLIPSISLLLVMVLRLVPHFTRKVNQITGARKAIGKGPAENSTKKEKLDSGFTVLGTLTSWALEGSVVTGDSMRARGYGCAKRTSFQVYRMTGMDLWLLILMSLLLIASLIAACTGQMNATFTPELSIEPISWGIGCYAAFLLIPTALHIKEAIQWHISRSRI